MIALLETLNIALEGFAPALAKRVCVSLLHQRLDRQWRAYWNISREAPTHA